MFTSLDLISSFVMFQNIKLWGASLIVLPEETGGGFAKVKTAYN